MKQARHSFKSRPSLRPVKLAPSDPSAISGGQPRGRGIGQAPVEVLVDGSGHHSMYILYVLVGPRIHYKQHQGGHRGAKRWMPARLGLFEPVPASFHAHGAHGDEVLGASSHRRVATARERETGTG